MGDPPAAEKPSAATPDDAKKDDVVPDAGEEAADAPADEGTPPEAADQAGGGALSEPVSNEETMAMFRTYLKEKMEKRALKAKKEEESTRVRHRNMLNTLVQRELARLPSDASRDDVAPTITELSTLYNAVDPKVLERIVSIHEKMDSLKAAQQQQQQDDAAKSAPAATRPAPAAGKPPAAPKPAVATKAPAASVKRPLPAAEAQKRPRIEVDPEELTRLVTAAIAKRYGEAEEGVGGNVKHAPPTVIAAHTAAEDAHTALYETYMRHIPEHKRRIQN